MTADCREAILTSASTSVAGNIMAFAVSDLTRLRLGFGRELLRQEVAKTEWNEVTADGNFATEHRRAEPAKTDG